MGAPHNQRVELADLCDVLVVVRQLMQHIAHGIQAGALLAVALDHGPGRICRIRIKKHALFGTRVVFPFVQRGQVDRAQLPLLEWVVLALLEPPQLLLSADTEPELDQVHAAAHQMALELRGLAHELGVLFVGAKAHHPLDTGAVVPTAVQQHNFAARGQVLHIALKVPLAALHFAGFFQRHHACSARVQVLHETLDGTALAGRIAPFKQNHDALPGFFNPGLQFEQLHLQMKLGFFVGAAAHQVAVGVAPVTPVICQQVVRVQPLLARLALDATHQRLSQHPSIVGRRAFEHGTQTLGPLLCCARGTWTSQVQRGGYGLALCRINRFAGDEFAKCARLGGRSNITLHGLARHRPDGLFGGGGFSGFGSLVGGIGHVANPVSIQ